MTITMSKEKLLTFYSGITSFKETSDKYIIFKRNFFPQEATDNEIVQLSEKLGVYSFLNDKSEDVYSLSDGSPME